MAPIRHSFGRILHAASLTVGWKRIQQDKYMKARIRYRQRSASLILCGLLLLASPAFSQEAETPTVHWAYASFFGTGWYKINDQQSAFIANFAPLWKSEPATWFGEGGEGITYSLRVPITVGVARLDFDDVPGILDPDNFSTTSIGLRADLDVPITERFSVRPNAQVSYGTVIGESVYAWTYRGDVRARYRLGSRDKDRALVAAAGVVAFDANTGVDDSFTYATLAAEFTQPLRRFSSKDSEVLLHWHLAYTQFPNRPKAPGRLGQLDEISNYWQVGLAYARKGEEIRLWFLTFERLGLACDISPSSDLRGIKFVFRSLYDP